MIGLGREGNGRAQCAETFRRVGLWVQVRLHIALEHAVGFNVRNVTQERQAQIGLDVVLVLDGVVKVIDEESQPDGDAQADDDTQKQRQYNARLDRVQRHNGAVND